MPRRISILGDGGWGTALAVLSHRKGHEVRLWGAFPDYLEEMRRTRENRKFLPGVKIAPEIQLVSSLEEAFKQGDVIVLAIPTQFLRNVLYKVRPHVKPEHLIVSVAKGLERRTNFLPSQVISSQIHAERLAVLSGPSHAEEVARNLPSCVVAASQRHEVAVEVQDVFMDVRFRVYTVEDVLGVELGAALKNVVAIAAGICDGLGYGSNTKAALLSRGLLEIMRLGVRMGASPNTFFGLSGLGDLVTTCISEFGRNRHVGEELGRGKRLSEILASMEQVAEGVETTRSAVDLAKREGVEMPIVQEVFKVLFEDKDAREAVDDLMLRDPKRELELNWK